MSNYNLKKAAQDARDVQNASNLSGILMAWHKAACAVNNEHLPHGEMLRHPINLLFMSKVASLMQVNTDCIGGIQIPINGEMKDAFSTAWNACEEIANEK